MPITFDDLLEYVSRGHAFPEHVEGRGNNFRGRPRNGANEFQQAGIDIRNPEDLKDYMGRMLDSPQTRGYVRGDGALVVFNSTDNVKLVFNPSRGEVDLGTIYPQQGAGASDFDTEWRQAQRHGQAFDNARTPGSVRAQAETFARSIPSNHPALSQVPGFRAEQDFPGSRNQTINQLSPQYRTWTSLSYVRASGLETGRGFIAGVSADNGLPTRMFFLDERTNRVTEINNSAVTVHTFNNLPEGNRAAAAQLFFESNRPPQAVISQGGVRGLVQEFQAHNTGGARLSEGVINSAVRTHLSANPGTVPTNIPYGSSADALHASEQALQRYLGWADAPVGQVDAFNRLPTNISADTLSRVSPNAIEPVRDLIHAKEMAMSPDAATREMGLKFFDETFRGMDASTRTAVMTALETVARAPIAETARAARGLATLSDLAEAARALKALRLPANIGKAGVVTTVALTAASVALTDRANAMTLDLAGQLHASGRLTDAAYRDYRQMMGEVGPMLTAQAADPFITAIPGMAIVERIAYNRFREFSDRHQLPQDVHEMLSPSMVAGTSLRGQIGNDTYRMIPTNPASAPPSLRELVEARQGVEAAQTAYNQAYERNRPHWFTEALMNMGSGEVPMGMPPSHYIITSTPEVQAAQQRLDEARSNFQSEFDQALANPSGARALAGLMTPDQLLEVVKATARFNTGRQDPLIENLVRAQEQGFLSGAWARMQAENALRQNPQVMRDYLSNLFTPRPGQRASLDIESNSDYVTVASAFERLKTGETLDTSEQAQIRQILNSTDPENRGIAEEISARYPQQAAQFITAGNSPSEPEVPAAASQASYSPSATRTQAMAI